MGKYTNNLNQDKPENIRLNREAVMTDWVFKIIGQEVKLYPLDGDASARRYFRIKHENHSWILMDSPIDVEPIAPFIEIANLLDTKTVPHPNIIASHDDGFLLLNDLGDTLLLDKLNIDTADQLYIKAMKHILQMQEIKANILPPFNRYWIKKELDIFENWYPHTKHCNKETRFKLYDTISNEIEKIPSAFMHRDFHSRNIMLEKKQNFSIIDFQGAMYGPITYDLISLIKDCYISWPERKIEYWMHYFYDHSIKIQNHMNLSQFTRACHVTSLQRHLKCLGIFHRLSKRDNKQGYLKHIPLVKNYVETSLKYLDLPKIF